MTVTANPSGATDAPVELVTLTIDDVEVSVPKGTLVIRAAEQIGIAIPRFCDHPLLAPAGACRQCLVEVSMPGPDGSLRPMPKPQASCTLEVGKGMVVRTQLTSTVADKAQRGVMELLEEINAAGTTIVMVTHDPELAARAQRNVHIVDGQVTDLVREPVLATPPRHIVAVNE